MTTVGFNFSTIKPANQSVAAQRSRLLVAHQSTSNTLFVLVRRGCSLFPEFVNELRKMLIPSRLYLKGSVVGCRQVASSQTGLWPVRSLHTACELLTKSVFAQLKSLVVSVIIHSFFFFLSVFSFLCLQSKFKYSSTLGLPEQTVARDGRELGVRPLWLRVHSKGRKAHAFYCTTSRQSVKLLPK